MLHLNTRGPTIYGVPSAVCHVLVWEYWRACGIRTDLTVISAYAPILDAEEDIKNQFYSQLDHVITTIHREDNVILLGDFNVRVGRDSILWNNIIGKEVVGKANSNGILLLSNYTEHDLAITNTLFRQKSMHKTTWTHPRSKHWHLLDYVIVRACDQKDVRITRAMRGAGVFPIDHRLVQSIMNIRLASMRHKHKKRTRRNTTSNPLKSMHPSQTPRISLLLSCWSVWHAQLLPSNKGSPLWIGLI